MKLVKRVSGILEVDKESGKIWLNTVNGCILRINKLIFENEKEKFSMIDITDNIALFYDDNSDSDNEFENFINDCSDIILYEKYNIDQDNMTNIYNDTKKFLLDKISHFKGENNECDRGIIE